MSNREKLEALRAFGLPVDQYAIIGSGPVGILKWMRRKNRKID